MIAFLRPDQMLSHGAVFFRCLLSIFIPVVCCLLHPLRRCPEIPFHPEALGIEQSGIEHTVGRPCFRQLMEPVKRLFRIRLCLVIAIEIQHSKRIHGRSVSLFRRFHFFIQFHIFLQRLCKEILRIRPYHLHFTEERGTLQRRSGLAFQHPVTETSIPAFNQKPFSFRSGHPDFPIQPVFAHIGADPPSQHIEHTQHILQRLILLTHGDVCLIRSVSVRKLSCWIIRFLVGTELHPFLHLHDVLLCLMDIEDPVW